jgi:hypothetical protein
MMLLTLDPAARADDGHFRRLTPQGFDVLEINRQQRLKHCSLSLSHWRRAPATRTARAQLSTEITA